MSRARWGRQVAIIVQELQHNTWTGKSCLSLQQIWKKHLLCYSYKLILKKGFLCCFKSIKCFNFSADDTYYIVLKVLYVQSHLDMNKCLHLHLISGHPFFLGAPMITLGICKIKASRKRSWIDGQSKEEVEIVPLLCYMEKTAHANAKHSRRFK